jgi:hypothetical protein
VRIGHLIEHDEWPSRIRQFGKLFERWFRQRIGFEQYPLVDRVGPQAPVEIARRHARKLDASTCIARGDRVLEAVLAVVGDKGLPDYAFGIVERRIGRMDAENQGRSIVSLVLLIAAPVAAVIAA